MSILTGVGIAASEYVTTGSVQSLGEVATALTTGIGLLMAKDYSQTGTGR